MTASPADAGLRTAPGPTGARPAPAAALVAVLGRYAPVLPVLLMVAVLGLPLTPGSAGSGGGSLADAVSGLVVAVCVAVALRRAERPLTRTAAIILGMPVVGIAVAAAGAGSPSTALVGMVRYCQIFVLVPVSVLVLVRDRRDFRLLARSFVGLALWQGGIGVHQYLTGTGASYMGEDIRAVGTFGPTDVMGMATVVSYGLVAALGLALGARTAARRVPALLCALALLLPLALSFSRGAWIATVVACGAQVLLAGVRRAVRLFAVAAAVAVVLVGGFGVGTQLLQERMSSITQVADAPDQSVTDRYTMWAAAVDMWSEHPATGVGLKGFVARRDSHASLALSSGSDTAGAGAAFKRQPLLSPHNMYLLILSEQGLIGLVGLAGGWVALLLLALRRLGRGAGTRPGADCGLVACGLLGWQLVDFVYADIGGPSTVLTALVIGLVAWWGLAPQAPLEEAATP
ncbi:MULTISPECIES: O-antigen ligase family protein [unclassified Streptomyces]|uniref:O-antigen ligase family protein n=1 Tax=unclassified Streptomyces TaxID=2593676 RepID=UPI0036EC5C86